MELIFKPFFDDKDEDLFIIEKRYHDGKEWYEEASLSPPFDPKAKYKVFRKSSRIIPDSDLEGTRQQMIQIAWAIGSRYEESTKHCAVKPVDNGFLIWSPRCTNGDPYLLDFQSADDIATQITNYFHNRK